MTTEFDENFSIKQWQLAINDWATDKGWNDGIEDRSQGDWASLAHSEISEALEHFRKRGNTDPFIGEDGKPDGSAIEYADLIIRVLHWAEVMGHDLGHLVAFKMQYNATRPERHGDVGRV